MSMVNPLFGRGCENRRSLYRRLATGYDRRGGLDCQAEFLLDGRLGDDRGLFLFPRF
jgi:hypothetical protein